MSIENILTIDHDGGIYEKNPRLLYWELYRETGKFPEVRRSSSGKGYHFIVKGISRKKVRELREKHDDKNRLELDRRTVNKPKQVLWDHKELRDGRVFPATYLKNMYCIEKVREVCRWRKTK
ncbi:MAG: hypothetical protein ACOCTT_01355 [archaeon]